MEIKKDFLCIDYSWVPNSRFIFNNLSKLYSVDIVDEKTLLTHNYANDYKVIILYLHEQHTIPITNKIISKYPNAKLVQHDDTDFEDIQIWSHRKPDLVMQRELTLNSKNPWGCAVAPHHFPIPSMCDNVTDKPFDVFFMGTMTNSRRIPFIRKLIELKEGALRHLSWNIQVTAADVRTPIEYRSAINRSKIGLHYYGNSYDSWRLWELASCGTCMLIPKLPLLSISDDFMPFNSPVTIKDDLSDLADKILYYLENDRWRLKGLEIKNDYDKNHTPDKCFEHYLKMLNKYIL